MKCFATLVAVLFSCAGTPLLAAQANSELRTQIEKLDVELLKDMTAEQRSNMLLNHAQGRLREANRRSTADWSRITTRAEWESFSRSRVEALRRSLGEFPKPPADLHTRITGTYQGNGFAIENLVFESRPGLLVTANLYRPKPLRESMPGILLAHSHHNPKTQGELQDMGMTWARLGCMVLVMDQLGHGERRQHPFVSAQDYAGQFPLGRQDYAFRYNTAIQLHLIGDSLMGWMVWDLQRGVDLLLSRRGIDRRRIALMGSVAGGGDPAAVAAALDQRITLVVPFNFGGPQPESPYPLPADAEETFGYAGSGSWESTRNLRLSCRDGFLPWVIVGSLAPRYLVYAHEFSWDRDRDPVWSRLRKIWSGFYAVPESLDFATGFGVLTGQPPQASHCNNIGVPHRERIHAALKKWFGVQGGPADEYQKRLPPEELLCLKPGTGVPEPRKLHQLALEIGLERAQQARASYKGLSAAEWRQRLGKKWQGILGNVAPGTPRVIRSEVLPQVPAGLSVEHVVLESEPGILVPLVLLKPSVKSGQKSGPPLIRPPVVLGLAQGGKAGFIRQRSTDIVELIRGGAAVCLPDLRGTGETRPGESRGRLSADTSISSTEWMLGETLAGARLRDVRTVIRFLQARGDLDSRRLALWGDSFAIPNGPERDLKVPYGIQDEPAVSEPGGGMLALLAALFEDSVRAVYVRGGLTSFESILESQFCYLPHDAVVPGALAAGDSGGIISALVRPVRLESLVDGLNRTIAPRRATDDTSVARWTLRHLAR